MFHTTTHSTASDDWRQRSEETGAARERREMMARFRADYDCSNHAQNGISLTQTAHNAGLGNSLARPTAAQN